MYSLENSALEGCFAGNILKMGIPPSLLPTACGSERERAQNLSPQGLAACKGRLRVRGISCEQLHVNGLDFN